MIELTKDKILLSKDPKLLNEKNVVLFDKSKGIRFTAAAESPRIVNASFGEHKKMYLGLSNGTIVTFPIYKTRGGTKAEEASLKMGEITILKAPESYGHRTPVSCMICEYIEDTPLLFSGGVDGQIIIWNGDPQLAEKKDYHHIRTIPNDEHKGTIFSMAYAKSKNILVVSSNDMTVRIYKADKKFDIIENPRFKLKQVIKDFKTKVIPEKVTSFYISTMTIKETDIIELCLGDTKGRALFYHYIDKEYGNDRLKEIGLDPEVKDPTSPIYDPKFLKKFHLIKEINLHRLTGTIKIIHSTSDSAIYSCGFDNHIICYNTKNDTKTFEIPNSNNKTHFTSLSINYNHQELIAGDDRGNITFIKIFNKEEIKIKAPTSQIFFLNDLDDFISGQEFLVVIGEDVFEIFKLTRKSKVSNKQHHEGEIFRIFSVDPIKVGEKIVEDAKLISASFDNTIKMWDFSSMECINNINGPELSRKNVDITCVCFLSQSSLIAVGTDIGNLFFYDLNRSEYLKNAYEKYYQHKSTITDIITFKTKDKKDREDEQSFKEHLISCSKDGLMFIWEIQKTEIREAKKEDTFSDCDKLLMQNSILNKKGIDDFLKEYNKDKLKPIVRKEKNYKFTPQIKTAVNALGATHIDVVLNKIAFQPTLGNNIVYTGTDEKTIHLWDFQKGHHLKITEPGNNLGITCMLFDGNFLLTGGMNGNIDVWNCTYTGIKDNIDSDRYKSSNINDYEAKRLEDQENRIFISLAFTLTDPGYDGKTAIIVNDMIMLTSIGILVSCNNYKKIHFWKYEQKQHLKTIQKEQYVSCLASVESYGKLISGTKEKTIVEDYLPDYLDPIGIKHEYMKYPFLKNNINYTLEPVDKEIGNNDIMKSLNEGIE